MYGGTERVVSYLTDKLVELGHEVTLYASGDSVSLARLVTVCPRALRLHGDDADPSVYHLLLLEKVFRESEDYDVIHFHLDFLPFPMLRRERVCHVSTLHGRLDLPSLAPLYREYSDEPVISISAAQRKPLPWLNWQGNVHHGIPRSLLSYHLGRGSYLAFLGRISPEKGLLSAIEIAERVRLPLKIAAKVDKDDETYFREQVQPRLKASRYAELIGEITEEQKNDFLGNAIALLFPICWPEPFGMVQIEAMACGTPVVAFPGGSVEEIVDPGIHDLGGLLERLVQLWVISLASPYCPE